MHEYYKYSLEELISSPRIPLRIMSDAEAVFKSMAREMADEIRSNNGKGKRTVFILPVGPVGQYPYFVETVNRERISLENTWFINMDEYLDDEKKPISSDNPLSFRGFMDREVYALIDPELNVPLSQRVFPDPDDPEHIGELIEKLGGVDICFGGIGLNGHVAFNEPDSSLTPEEFRALPARVLKISGETRGSNAIGNMNGALEEMPRYAVTVGLKEISASRKIRLGIFRNWHKAVVRRAAHGEMTADFPVSILAGHPDILISLPESLGEP